jgi:hypothetical protein
MRWLEAFAIPLMLLGSLAAVAAFGMILEVIR